MRELYKISDLVADVKRRMVKWLGHVLRLERKKVAKRISEVSS
jgi:hypothetical protein